MSWKEMVVLAVIAVLLLVLQRIGRRHGQDTRASRLMKTYAVMTQEKLDAVPDGELVDAVVSRILAKAEQSHRPDPIVTLASLPNDNTVVYTVWVICKELAVSDYETMMKTAAKDFADLAKNAFDAIGAAQCAQDWQTLHTAEKKTVAMQDALRLTIQTECPLTLCEEYIRDHAQAFIDE